MLTVAASEESESEIQEAVVGCMRGVRRLGCPSASFADAPHPLGPTQLECF